MTNRIGPRGFHQLREVSRGAREIAIGAGGRGQPMDIYRISALGVQTLCRGSVVERIKSHD